MRAREQFDAEVLLMSSPQTTSPSLSMMNGAVFPARPVLTPGDQASPMQLTVNPPFAYSGEELSTSVFVNDGNSPFGSEPVFTG